MPPSTVETITVITESVGNVFGSVNTLPNVAKITAIFIINDILEPSLCKGAPNGIITFLTCAGILIFSAPSRLARIVAMLTQVPYAINDSLILFFQNTLNPNFT